MRILLLMLLLIPFSAIADEKICGNVDAKGIPEDLAMPESEFSLENAKGMVEYFDKDLPKMIQDAKKPGDIFNSPRFYISHPNGITMMRGFFLKHEYLIAKYEYEISKLKNINMKSKKKDYLNKKDKFCQFMKDIPVYVD